MKKIGESRAAVAMILIAATGWGVIGAFAGCQAASEFGSEGEFA